ncbi:MAG: enoyl-CoA hydratase family protein [Planctomycetes bacterium]|nr:enoyl-CoA hydratase family protein [Planctomycetota bacterium]
MTTSGPATPPPPAGGLPFEWSVDHGVGTLTLSRPEVLNALTFEVYAALAKKLRDLRDDDEVRALVITGKGRGFCSGGDVDGIIGALFECDTKDVLEFTRMTGEVIENVRRLDKPVVAAVNGVAAGAGAVIALASDLRVMADGAKFAFLFTKVGLTGADMGAAYLLPRVVGLGRATELLMLGDPVDAAKALAIGLATRVVPKEQVLAEATALARRLAEGPGLALSMTKRLLVHEQSMDLASAIEVEAVAQALLLRAKDHRTFYDAYKAGKPAAFQGR